MRRQVMCVWELMESPEESWAKKSDCWSSRRRRRSRSAQGVCESGKNDNGRRDDGPVSLGAVDPDGGCENTRS